MNQTSDRGTTPPPPQADRGTTLPQAAAMASLVGDLLNDPSNVLPQKSSFPEPSKSAEEGFGDLIGSSTPVSAPQSSAPRSAAPVTDLIGGFEGETYTTASHVTGPSLVPVVSSKAHVVDLMGGFEDSSFPPSSSTSDPATSSALSNPLPSHSALLHASDDLGDDFFSGGAAKLSSEPPAPSAPPARASIPPASRPSRTVSRPAASDLIGDLNSLGDVDVGNNQHLYEVDEEGERQINTMFIRGCKLMKYPSVICMSISACMSPTQTIFSTLICLAFTRRGR